jgi:tetratricopeptide (TPR) repeat protein
VITSSGSESGCVGILRLKRCQQPASADRRRRYTAADAYAGNALFAAGKFQEAADAYSEAINASECDTDAALFRWALLVAALPTIHPPTARPACKQQPSRPVLRFLSAAIVLHAS